MLAGIFDHDYFRRLARSSPWLWRSIAFTHDDGEMQPVRALIIRPDAIRVEDVDGRVLHADVTYLTGGQTLTHGTAAEPESIWWTDAPAPPLDTDGLVADPVSLPYWVVLDDPMWQTYRWVAMLNPRELADGADGTPAVQIDGLGAEIRHGRRTLWAVVRPTDGYDPRCSCCPLLPSRQAALADGLADPAGPFADAHRVALDIRTGICVSAREIGGPNPGRGFDVEIESVDCPPTPRGR